MPYQLDQQIIETDANGYLLDHTQWSEALVPVIAEAEGIELNDAHWLVIRFVREFYMQYDTSPAIRALVKALAQAHGPEIGNSRYLQKLLPKGPAKLASKLAGLPKPAKCL
jgi:tRNA 2-thiouridine synthesizing protein E